MSKKNFLKLFIVFTMVALVGISTVGCDTQTGSEAMVVGEELETGTLDLFQVRMSTMKFTIDGVEEGTLSFATEDGRTVPSQVAFTDGEVLVEEFFTQKTSSHLSVTVKNKAGDIIDESIMDLSPVKTKGLDMVIQEGEEDDPAGHDLLGLFVDNAIEKEGSYSGTIIQDWIYFSVWRINDMGPLERMNLLEYLQKYPQKNFFVDSLTNDNYDVWDQFKVVGRDYLRRDFENFFGDNAVYFFFDAYRSKCVSVYEREIKDDLDLGEGSIPVGTSFEELDLPEEVPVPITDVTGDEDRELTFAINWLKGEYDEEKTGTYTLVGEIEIHCENISNPQEYVVFGELTLTPGAVDQMTIEVQPTDTTAGEPIDPAPQVKVTDEFGNPLPGITVTVTLPDASTDDVDTNEDGIAIFEDLAIDTAGTYTLTFAVDGLDDAESEEFAITAADPQAIVIETQPEDSSVGVNVGGPPEVGIIDAFENPVKDVTVSISAKDAEDPEGTLEKTTDEDGKVVFDDLKFRSTGTFTLVVEANSLTKEMNEITVTRDPYMDTVQRPTDTIAGEEINPAPAVKLFDENNDPIDGAEVTVQLVDAQDTEVEKAFATGETTVTTGADGIATFPGLIIETAGSYRLIYSTDADGIEDKTSVSFAVKVADVDEIVITQQPGNSVAGEAIDAAPEVRVQDAFANVIADVEVTAELLNNGETFASGETVLVTDEEGKAAFTDLIIEKAATDYRIKFTVNGVEKTSEIFFVEAADPYALEILTQPKETVAGEAVAGYPEVRVTDAFDNPVPEATVTMEVGDLTQDGETDADGRFVFDNIVIEVAGTYNLTFTVGAVDPVDSDEFDVVAADPFALEILTQPEETVAGEAVVGYPEVRVTDAFDNPVPKATVTMEVGDLTQDGETDADGRFVFDNIVIEVAGTYNLTFTVGAVHPVDSDEFDVVAAAPHRIEVDGPEALVNPGKDDEDLTVNYTATVYDEFDNVSPELVVWGLANEKEPLEEKGVSIDENGDLTLTNEWLNPEGGNEAMDEAFDVVAFIGDIEDTRSVDIEFSESYFVFDFELGVESVKRVNQLFFVRYSVELTDQYYNHREPTKIFDLLIESDRDDVIFDEEVVAENEGFFVEQVSVKTAGKHKLTATLSHGDKPITIDVEVSSAPPVISTTNGTLVINSVVEGATLKIYDMDDTLVATVEDVEVGDEIDIAPGTYYATQVIEGIESKPSDPVEVTEAE